MKKLCLFLAVIFISQFAVNAQDKLSGNIFGGILIPQNDFSKNDYSGSRANLGLGAGLGYQVFKPLRARIDFMTGTMNGNNTLAYYETSIYEVMLSAEYDVLDLMLKNPSPFKVNIIAGGGLMGYYARMYDINTGLKLTESPVRDKRSLSPNTVISYGLNVGYAVTKKLDVTLGFINRYVETADWMDGVEMGGDGDHYGIVQVGLVYKLVSDRDPKSVEVKKTKYDSIMRQVDNLTKENEQVEAKIQREKDNCETKVAKAEEIQSKLDSLQEIINHPSNVIVSTDGASTDGGSSTGVSNDGSYKATGGSGSDGKTGSGSTVPPIVASTKRTNSGANTPTGEKKYRIIVVSLSSKAKAEAWINSTSLDNSEMQISYSPDQNSYRVIYKTYETMGAAYKDLPTVRAVVKDAWVYKL